MFKHICAALFLTLPAVARVGETQAECVKRYGAATSREGDSAWSYTTHARDGVTVSCWFEKDACTSIAFKLISGSRVSAGRIAADARFTPAQVETLLKANSGGSEWKRDGGNEFEQLYVTADGKRRALVHEFAVTVQLVSDIERRAALLKPEAVGKAIEGF